MECLCRETWKPKPLTIPSHRFVFSFFSFLSARSSIPDKVERDCECWHVQWLSKGSYSLLHSFLFYDLFFPIWQRRQVMGWQVKRNSGTEHQMGTENNKIKSDHWGENQVMLGENNSSLCLRSIKHLAVPQSEPGIVVFLKVMTCIVLPLKEKCGISAWLFFFIN